MLNQPGIKIKIGECEFKNRKEWATFEFFKGFPLESKDKGYKTTEIALRLRDK